MKIIITESQLKNLIKETNKKNIVENDNEVSNILNFFKSFKNNKTNDDNIDISNVIPSDSGLMYPLEKHYPITSHFGRRSSPTKNATSDHKGVDIGVPCGSNVLASEDGVIETAEVVKGYGGYILLKTDRYSIRYGHLSKFMVNSGQQVKKGQIIGLSGRSGIATGCHLHYEIRDLENKLAYNPESVQKNLA